MEIILNILFTSIILSVVLTISKTNAKLGGFILSLPLSTLIVLAMNRIQLGNAGNTFELAKSTFIAVPLTLVFFIPFLFADKFKLGFWSCYSLGFFFLILSYFAHQFLMKNWID
jgi:hypothetical protein